MKRLCVFALFAALLPVSVAAQDTATTSSKKHTKRRGKRRASATQSTNAPAPPTPDTPHDPMNATREQLPGNPQPKPAGPDK